MTPFRKCTPPTEADVQSVLEDHRKAGLNITEQEVRDSICQGTTYRNDKYQVVVRKLGNDWVHLSIKRIDREPVHDWRDLWQIKNMLVGLECEAVELYPADSRLVDEANQYHLWANASPLFRFPWGFKDRLVADALPEGTKAKQRPRIA